MPFNASDSYVGDNSLKLNYLWAPTVWKQDGQTFYNWEQDNRPTYDLEERTELLWERAGFPTSSLQNTGANFIVSASAPNSPPNHFNTFTSLEDAIKALPDIINYPIKIEVCLSGNLGSLELNSVKYGPHGALEIINRLYSKGNSLITTKNAPIVCSTTTAILPNNEKTVLQLSALDLYLQIKDASCMAVSSNIFASAAWNASNRIFAGGGEWISNTAKNHHNITVGIDSPSLLMINPSANFLIGGYGQNQDLTASTHDIVIRDGITDSILTRSSNPTAFAGGVGGNPSPNIVLANVYGNYLTSLEVNNCVGPLFIRNFCVDGGSGTGATLNHNNLYGIKIINSDFVLENCATMRNKKAGAFIKSSKVTLSRSFIAFRNYELYSPTQRFEYQITPGLLAIDSEITLSGTSNSTAAATSEGAYAAGVDIWMAFCYNGIGMRLHNSVLTGGVNRGFFNLGELTAPGSVTFNELELSAQNTNKAYTYWQFFKNTDAGLSLENSVVDTRSRICAFHNKVGVRAKNSTLNLRELTAEYNQEFGLHLDNSVCRYNYDYWPARSSNYNNLNQLSQFQFVKNGQHLLVENNSDFVTNGYVSASPYLGANIGLNGMENIFGQLIFSAHMGVSKTYSNLKVSLPGIEVANNSRVDFVHPRITCNSLAINDAIYGAGVSVKNNSSVRFNGTDKYSTIILGPTTLTTKTAGVHADNNSNVLFCGPSLIANWGVPVLASKNSEMSFTPHTNERNNAYDLVTWQLSNTANHTQVNLHSRKACLVADDNSIINMKDLGDYHTFWSGTAVYSSLVVSTGNVPVATYNALDTLGLAGLTTSGYMQFYPNPQQGNTNFTLPAVSQVDLEIANTTKTLLATNLPFGTEAEHKVYSQGGVVVKAVGGSKVNVKNVHFPAGWENPSGTIYDASEPCCKLYIWNIGDGCHLTARFTSVSGIFPSFANYYGPNSTYKDGISALRGAPSSTPHSKYLSVLDSFGQVISVPAATYPGLNMVSNNYGKSNRQNRGPFRIYFSPASEAKFLGYVKSGAVVYGEPYQQIAQNYNPSGNCSSTVSGTGLGAPQFLTNSDIYVSLYPEFKTSGAYVAGNLGDASAFFYTSAFLDPGYKYRIQLDDAGINTFANAKNSVIGGSGRPQLISYLREIIVPQGEGYDADFTPNGMGFLSASRFDLSENN